LSGKCLRDFDLTSVLIDGARAQKSFSNRLLSPDLSTSWESIEVNDQQK